nr:hypothetical protein [Tanacetum cinerariifolium]
MRNRSKSYPNNSNATILRRQNRKRVPNIVEPEIRTIEEVVPMADRTMEELLQAPTEGYGEAIVIPKILAENFEIITNLLQESSSKTDDRIDKLANQISNLVEIVNKQLITPAMVKAVEKSCVICGGADAYYDCIATDSNQSGVCATTGSFFQNQTPISGTLLSNTIANPKGEMKVVTTHSGLAYKGPSIPTNSSIENVVERETEETTDKEQPNCQGSTTHIQPPVVPTPISEPDHFDISFADALLLMPKFASTIKSLLTNKDKLFELTKVPLNENFSAMLLKKLPEKLGDTGKWKNLFLPELTPTRMTLELADRYITRAKGVAEDVFVNVRKFHFPTDFVIVDFEADPRYNSKIGYPTMVSNPSLSKETKSEFCKEPIVKSFSPTLTPFGESDFLVEEIEDFLNDESIPTGIEDSYHDPEVNILYLEKLINDDPSQLPPMDLKQAKETKENLQLKCHQN